MKNQSRNILSGLVFLMAAVALAMVRLFTAPLLLPFLFLLVLSYLKGLASLQKTGYLKTVRSVCKIE